MALSGRMFGFGSLSMLIPQVLEGVAAVALLYAGVRRWFGAGAGLLAGLLLAITPVAALMFRFNNPAALLVCLLVAAAYCLIRAIEGASTQWLLPAALVALLLGLWRTRQAARTDRTRAALLLWGGWLFVSGVVFSLGSGVIHTYYTVAGPGCCLTARPVVVPARERAELLPSSSMRRLAGP